MADAARVSTVNIESPLAPALTVSSPAAPQGCALELIPKQGCQYLGQRPLPIEPQEVPCTPQHVYAELIAIRLKV